MRRRKRQIDVGCSKRAEEQEQDERGEQLLSTAIETDLFCTFLAYQYSLTLLLRFVHPSFRHMRHIGSADNNS